ncbi:hypothetical protein [Burkholderia ubonensis]|uniref:hypothetical protein n=1 Tax=Burkholderia ubonensis TaxID=101571 RepID=UPI000F574BAB|nr:hypothetical protein [Burkholderia ubonensis]
MKTWLFIDKHPGMNVSSEYIKREISKSKINKIWTSISLIFIKPVLYSDRLMIGASAQNQAESPDFASARPGRPAVLCRSRPGSAAGLLENP